MARFHNQNILMTTVIAFLSFYCCAYVKFIFYFPARVS
ncbi:Hypothetical protein ABZS17G119_03839 [Kosakonia cowanii]